MSEQTQKDIDAQRYMDDLFANFFRLPGEADRLIGEVGKKPHIHLLQADVIQEGIQPTIGGRMEMEKATEECTLCALLVNSLKNSKNYW